MRAWQAKLSPQDMDMLRIQVQEELEGPHQQRVAALEGEAEKVRIFGRSFTIMNITVEHPSSYFSSTSFNNNFPSW
jgi:hypothetical protein